MLGLTQPQQLLLLLLTHSGLGQQPLVVLHRAPGVPGHSAARAAVQQGPLLWPQRQRSWPHPQHPAGVQAARGQAGGLLLLPLMLLVTAFQKAQSRPRVQQQPRAPQQQHQH